MAGHAIQTAARQSAQKAAGAQVTFQSPARQGLRHDNEVRTMQSVIGNQAMQRSFLAQRSGIPEVQRKCASCDAKSEDARTLQTKLAMNQPGDALEQEADRVAEAVMSAGSAPL